jgi:hypothetical protein
MAFGLRLVRHFFLSFFHVTTMWQYTSPFGQDCSLTAVLNWSSRVGSWPHYDDGRHTPPPGIRPPPLPARAGPIMHGARAKAVTQSFLLFLLLLHVTDPYIPFFILKILHEGHTPATKAASTEGQQQDTAITR